MTYDQEQLNDALIALEDARDRQEVLEHHLRERDALIAKYERLVRGLVGAMAIAALLLLAVVWVW